MEKRVVEGDVPAESLRRRRPSRRRFRPSLTALAPRAGVLLALGLATIAAPVVHTLGPLEIVAAPVASGGPSAHSVFAGGPAVEASTSVLAALPVTVRMVEDVSRTLERDALPGCDGSVPTTLVNGQIPSADLCALWDGSLMLRGDAAVSLSELNENYVAAFGRNLCLTDGYRSYAEQGRLAAIKPGLAAAPGQSNHGYGLAIDLCNSETRNGDVMAWLWDNGPVYGWVNPDWAQRGGSGAYEPWHWEYLPGTQELGTAW